MNRTRDLIHFTTILVLHTPNLSLCSTSYVRPSFHSSWKQCSHSGTPICEMNAAQLMTHEYEENEKAISMLNNHMTSMNDNIKEHMTSAREIFGRHYESFDKFTPILQEARSERKRLLQKANHRLHQQELQSSTPTFPGSFTTACRTLKFGPDDSVKPDDSAKRYPLGDSMCGTKAR